MRQPVDSALVLKPFLLALRPHQTVDPVNFLIELSVALSRLYDFHNWFGYFVMLFELLVILSLAIDVLQHGLVLIPDAPQLLGV